MGQHRHRFKGYILLAAFILLLVAGVLAACTFISPPISYTLRFVAGEGISIPDIVAEAGEDITPPSDPERDGFTFGGWYLGENGEGDRQVLPNVMPKEDRTYYAKWDPLSPPPARPDFSDIAGKTFPDALGSGATLALQEDGRAVFAPETGEVLAGRYFPLGEEGNFLLTVDEGLTIPFALTLKGDALCFLRGDGSYTYGGEYILAGETLLYYLGTGESFRVPDGVHVIGENAFLFEGAKNLTSVDFNEAVRVEPRAFCGVTKLQAVEGDLEHVGKSAFEGLKTLEHVILPRLKLIGERAFFGCDALTSVKLAEVERLESAAFSRFAEGQPLTIDLTQATSLHLSVAEDAFAAIGEENVSIFVEGSEILVKDVDALNGAIQAFGSALSPMPIAIQTEKEDTMSGVAFYDFLEGALYLFDNFEVTKHLYINYSWTEERVASYYLAEGVATVYALGGEGTYVSFGAYTGDSPRLVLGDREALALGSKEQPALLLTEDKEGRKLEISYYVTLSMTWGISLNKYVTGVKYDGVEGETVNFSYSGELTFKTGNRAYRGSIVEGVFEMHYLGMEYVLEDTSDPFFHFRSTVRVDDAGNVELLKNETKADPDSEGARYWDFYGSKAEGENVWRGETGGKLLQFTITLNGQGVPSLRGEILGDVVSVYAFAISYSATVKVEEGKIAKLVEFREHYITVPEEKITTEIAEDGLSMSIQTPLGKYGLTLSEEGGKASFSFTVQEFTQNTISDEQYKYSADVRFKVVGEEKVMIGIAHFYHDTNYETPIRSQTLNEDNSVTIETEDGKKYQISMGVDRYGFECLVVKEVG